MTDKTPIETAEGTLNANRMAVRDLVQRAYDAGRTPDSGRVRADPKPTADEVNKAVQAVERGAVLLAHARMEYVAKACGFEGLTEALGYLQTLRANPIADLLREAVKLVGAKACAGDGFSDWYDRARAVVGDKPPPAEEVPEELTLTTQQEMCVAEIGAVLERQTGDAAADTWDFYGLPRTRVVCGEPVYFWRGREGRPSTNRYRKNAEGLPTGCEHVMIDETRGDPSGPAPVCRIVESIEPLSLGHTLCISREELEPLDEGAWVPKGGATTSHH